MHPFDFCNPSAFGFLRQAKGKVNKAGMLTGSRFEREIATLKNTIK